MNLDARYRGCWVKIAYATFGQAARAARSLRRTSGELLRPYRCRWAEDPEHWHVGHPRLGPAPGGAVQESR